MPIDIVTQLISAAMGTGLGYGLKYGIDKASTVLIRDRLSRKAWSFLGEPTHIFLPLSEGPNNAAGGYGDLLAMSHVINVANRLFRNKNLLTVHPDQNDYESVRNEHLVVIGGGKYNSVYRKLVEDLSIPLHFFDTATESFHEIRNKERSVVYSPQYDREGCLTHDLGLLIRAKNPRNRQKYIIMAAGSHTYGSAAAVEYLLNTSTLRDISKHLNENFEIVIRASIRKHSIAEIERVSNILSW